MSDEKLRERQTASELIFDGKILQNSTRFARLQTAGVSRREQYEPAARGTFSASSDKYVLVVCQIRLRPSLPKSARKNTPCGAMQFCRELILGKDKAKT